jgi:uncharacterized heparinase superfamily protein
MPVQVLRHIRRSASQLAYKSVLYNWSLRGAAPERILVKPVDPWPGNADAGRWLVSGAFVIDGEQLELRGECWEPYGVDDVWLEHMHGFTWLRDLRALGGDTARRQARAMIGSWIGHYRLWHRLPWRADIAGERVAMWIALYEFFGDSAHDEFQDMFFDSLVRQARHLSRALPGNVHGIRLLQGIKGLLYAGLAFEGYEGWIEQALELLHKEIVKQILPDGAHVSRSPAQLQDALQILLDVRGALTSGGYPLPEVIQHALDRMGPALRFFRNADKGFSLFNGTQEGDEALTDCIFGQANIRGKGVQSLPCAGYERVNLGRTQLIFDCGKPPAWPYDTRAHAAPLAFELSYGKDRLFVACGTHPTARDWQDALRATAAHTAAVIDCRNACEIRDDGHFARKVRQTEPLREETKKECLLEASHDGYVPLCGVTHRRRLFLTDKGHDLRGEDIFTCGIGLSRPLDIAVRFHIHPAVLVSLIRDGEEALMRLPGGIGWRFHHAGGGLVLEDSVYLGQGGRPRKTKQLVIYSRMDEDHTQIKWALQREG